MFTTRPSSAAEVTTGPLTGSRKVYTAPDGHDDVPVPFREIALGKERPQAAKR